MVLSRNKDTITVENLKKSSNALYGKIKEALTKCKTFSTESKTSLKDSSEDHTDSVDNSSGNHHQTNNSKNFASHVYSDAVINYSKLVQRTDKGIKSSLGKISTIERLIRKEKLEEIIKYLLTIDQTTSDEFKNLPTPESVFAKKWKKEGKEFLCACVRTGGKYSVCVLKRDGNAGKDIVDIGQGDPIFPANDKDRNYVFFDNTYPLIGVDESKEDLIFLTGAEFKKNKQDRYSKETDIVYWSGFRIAKLNISIMLETSIKQIKEQRNELTVNEMSITSFISVLAEDANNKNDPKDFLRIYNFNNNSKKSGGELYFTLNGIQTDSLRYSWCNKGGVRSCRSGAFSGNSVEDMNDLSCFSDCIDIKVSLRNENVTIIIEGGRKVIEASTGTAILSDNINYAVTPEMRLPPVPHCLSAMGMNSTNKKNDEEDENVHLSLNNNNSNNGLNATTLCKEENSATITEDIEDTSVITDDEDFLLPYKKNKNINMSNKQMKMKHRANKLEQFKRELPNTVDVINKLISWKVKKNFYLNEKFQDVFISNGRSDFKCSEYNTDNIGDKEEEEEDYEEEKDYFISKNGEEEEVVAILRTNKEVEDKYITEFHNQNSSSYGPPLLISMIIFSKTKS